MIDNLLDRLKENTSANFFCKPKKLQDGNYVQFHLVDCMVFNRKMFPRIYNDATFTITIIRHVFTHWSTNIPQVVYLQLDNTGHEKKSNYIRISKHACWIGNISKGKSWCPSF